jgi:uncharacterized protein (DUF1499 family)
MIKRKGSGMKLLLMVILVLPMAVVLFLAVLSWTARPPQTGLEQGRLRPCPDTPNCVSSEEDADAEQQIAPLVLKPELPQSWSLLGKAVELEGGRVVRDEAGYLHATWTSRWFRFVDDMELRLDEAAAVVHMRSASRAGYSDLGVNRRRLESLRRRFQNLQEEAGSRSMRRP